MTPFTDQLLAVAGEVFEAEIFHLLQPSASPASQRRSLGLPPRPLARGFVAAASARHDSCSGSADPAL